MRMESTIDMLDGPSKVIVGVVFSHTAVGYACALELAVPIK